MQSTDCIRLHGAKRESFNHDLVAMKSAFLPLRHGLAALTDLPAEKLEWRSISAISDDFRHVWVPRFDIDWVLPFRRDRYCYLIIFQRPTLGVILKGIEPCIPVPFPPNDPWACPCPHGGP